jgi:hypothetical protein
MYILTSLPTFAFAALTVRHAGREGLLDPLPPPFPRRLTAVGGKDGGRRGASVGINRAIQYSVANVQ